MSEIGKALMAYREAVRALWNAYFAPNENLATWDSYEALDQVRSTLFQVMVVDQFQPVLGSWQDFERPLDGLAIRPIGLDDVPIAIEQPRVGDRNHYWDHPLTRVRRADVDLRFVAFFDWWVLGYEELQYYRVRILRCAGAPEVVGRDALLAVQYGEACLV